MKTETLAGIHQDCGGRVFLTNDGLTPPRCESCGPLKQPMPRPQNLPDGVPWPPPLPPPAPPTPPAKPAAQTLDPETADRVLLANVSNILKKAKSGKPLTAGEIEIIEGYRNQTQEILFAQSDPGATLDTAAAAVYQLLVRGATKAEVLQACAKQYPQHDAKKIISTALDTFRIATQEPPEVTRGIAIEATRYIYRRALESKDLAAALRAMAQIVKLTSEPRGKSAQDQPEELEPEGLPAELAELIKKANSEQ